MSQTVSEQTAENRSEAVGRIPDTAPLVSLRTLMAIHEKTRTDLFLKGCSRRVHHIDTTTSILGEIDASKAPRMNRKIARPVKEVKADMMHKLEPQPKNCVVSALGTQFQQGTNWTYAKADPLVDGELDEGIDRHWTSQLGVRIREHPKEKHVRG